MAVDAIVESLGHRDEGVRRQAAMSLAGRASKRNLEGLLKHESSDDPFVRETVEKLINAIRLELTCSNTD